MRFYLPQRGLVIRLLFTSAMTLVLAITQTDRGTITGTITDPTGAVVPNAALHARNPATGAEYDMVTTATGNYTIPGHHQCERVSVTHPGTATGGGDPTGIHAAEQQLLG